MSGVPVTLEWAGVERRFALAIGHLRELQSHCGIGPQALWVRMVGPDWRVDDAREVIRLGLIGGGMEPSKASALIRDYYDPWIGDPVHLPTARAILAGAMTPPVGVEVPKDGATGTNAPETPQG
jgi:hypothetical protein